VVSSPLLENRLRFGPFELDPEHGELRRSGAPIRLSPQPLKLLVLLASRPGEVVSRDEIRDRLWGTETFVDFEQGVNHCIRSIRAVLEQGVRSPVYIETVPRRGYRFVAPVRAGDLEQRAAEAVTERLAATDPALAIVRAPARGAWARLRRWTQEWLRRSRLWTRTQVRLAVLPFDNLTGDAEGGSLSGGLTAEISTQLTRAAGEGLHLVSSCSAKALNQMSQPVSAAREKGVDFLLGGTIWSSAGRARVNAYLVRVSDETQLWNESYDRALDDVFKFHTDVARAIAEGARTRLEI
jgi:DNA-binding winged helix-turn-helix (wHTH) protein/TolB-like protein